ncbi:ComF family protein [Actibacterium sp. 188UL27-1]|uniref:ComF family protein n=1 Tax=Actibacterium sp. 188UL27-1 TaxID=2786961 RepID=UPI00195EBA16|nr:ComF family protein [Actibacterium sp. 188UL27-1]MBM7067295.1 ComF family protein [Actibacterium sp. 188UL27-1]
MGVIQRLFQTVYPPQCLSCGDVVGENGGLCGTCWRDTPFISGVVCDSCGVPLPGDAPDENDPHPQCDECLAVARPWSRGRAAMLYDRTGRRLVLALKHGDRTESIPALAAWMHRAATPILEPSMLIAPVPLHWMRLVRRRYNQSVLLGQAVAKRAGLAHCPDLLVRHRATPTQEGRGRDARFANVSSAIGVHPMRKHRLVGRKVLLIDDVMTSGATFAAATEACLAAGASEVRILALARVAKDA